MRSILFAIMILCNSAFADDADGIVGGYENNADGMTYLLAESGPCNHGLRMAAARNANGLIVAAGCYGVHNGLTVVILWVRGPATVVPVSRVTWKQAVPQGPAVPAGPSS